MYDSIKDKSARLIQKLKEDENMFKIGDFSRLSSVSVRMLRHYEKMGLLIPEQVDQFTGFRYYSAEQLARMNKIQHLRQLGFSLALVKEMLDADSPADMERYFALRKAEIEEEMSKVSTQGKLLEQAFEVLKGDQSIMEYTVILKEIPERKVASVRGILPQYNQEGMLWGKLYEGIHRLGVKQPKEPLMMAVYHDREYKESDADVEVQTQVEGDYPDTDAIKFHTVPAVQVASVTFNGSYDLMGKVTEAAAQWIESNGYQMDGEMFNIYYVGPPMETNPDKWVTEACFPVSKA